MRGQIQHLAPRSGIELLRAQDAREAALERVPVAANPSRFFINWREHQVGVWAPRLGEALAPLTAGWLQRLGGIVLGDEESPEELRLRAQAARRGGMAWWRARLEPVRLRQRLCRAPEALEAWVLPPARQGSAPELAAFSDGAFTPTHVADRRGELIASIEKALSCKIDSAGMTALRDGLVEEHFHLPAREEGVASTGSEIRVGLSVTYGFAARQLPFHGRVSRTVLVCTNGMTDERLGQVGEWRPGSRRAFSAFAEALLGEVVVRDLKTRERLEGVRRMELPRERAIDLITRLNVAEATRDRVLARWHEEVLATGYSEWSMSQALTWLGVPERREVPSPWAARDLGTRVFHDGVDALLAEAERDPERPCFSPFEIMPSCHPQVRTARERYARAFATTR